MNRTGQKYLWRIHEKKKRSTARRRVNNNTRDDGGNQSSESDWISEPQVAVAQQLSLCKQWCGAVAGAADWKAKKNLGKRDDVDGLIRD